MYFTPDNNGYVNFGDVARDILGMQCQYCSAYAEPDTPPPSRAARRSPYLGAGLSITGTPDDYHAMQIHKNSIAAFVLRVVVHKFTQGAWSQAQVTAALTKLSQVVTALELDPVMELVAIQRAGGCVSGYIEVADGPLYDAVNVMVKHPRP